MRDPKEQVLAYLRTDRSMTGGRNLYNKLPGKSLAMQMSFSRMSNTETNLYKVHYELAKLAGLQERNLKIELQKPLGKQAEQKPDDIKKEPPADLEPIDKLLLFDPENADYFESKSLAKELGLNPVNRKKETLFNLLSGARKAEITRQVSELPKEVRASIKLRDQFPFLRDKDCPDFLKLLINDLITSYENFAKNQAKLHDMLNEADAAVLTETVLEDYISNKEAYAELEHYKETGEILGKHPLYERLQEKEEISALSTPKLTKRISNIKNRIGRNKKKENAELVQRDEDLLAHAEAVLSKR